MSNTSNNKTANSKPTKSKDKDKLRVIVGEIGRDSKTGILGRGYSSDNGKTFHVTDTMYGRLYDPNDIEGIWNGGTADKVKKEVDSATAEIPAAVSAANSAVQYAESAVAASKVNSDAIVAQSEAISEAKAALDSATAEIQQTAANAASDAAKIRADVAQVQNEVDTAKAANSASVEALKSDVSAAKQDLADVHDSLTKAQSAIEQNQKLINDSVAKITSDVSATKQELATVHDSLTKAQAAAEQNQKAIDDSIAKINANVDVTNQDLAGVRKDLTKAQSDIAANQKSINDNVAQINADITQDRKDIADVRQGLTKAQSDITANQKVVNDNFAQINSNIEQDRKDIASAQQANADTAKQLDTYSKQTTEQSKTIKTIQDKQDGFTATLADVQGNVSQVSDKVDGLSASLKDAQDNVSSVKAQADQLSATLTDHAKSIATLTASAKELSSTLEDADGRLSKVEQTAKTNSSTLADVQGDLSQVKQDATALTSTLKDAQGNISTLQQKADSVSAQLTSAQGDIATLQAGVDGIKATLASHDKTIHTLQLDSKSLKDSMADAQGDISTLSKTATSLDSEMKDHAGRLSKVEQTAATQATTLSDLQGNLSQVKQTADGIETTLKSAQGDIDQIKQTAKGTSEQLADVKGNVTNIQKDVNGLKQTTADNAGNIHTLQSDSKALKDDMADAKGNISSLQKTATSLDSEFKDHTGRLSKVEQNAATQATTLSDLQGNLSQVKQTADGIETTLKSAQGDIDQIKQTAKGTSEQLADVKGNVTNIQKDVNGLKQTTADNAGNIHTLQSDSKALKDDMADAKGNISSLQKTATSLDSEFKDHTGRLSKVEQNAATQATTLSDLQGNLSQVKQTADGIETTLKSAQGDIDQIKQTAKGTSEQLSNVQGDVTNIQKDVNGLKQTTADNAGNIHTLQSDSKSLHDSMQDAQGDISTLKKTSTDVTSELKDHAGRISKTEQTASTLVNEFADQQGHLNRVEQTAQGTQQTVANQQGQINTIKTDASGIHETLTGQGNQIANINVTLNGLSSKYEGVSGDLGKLKDQTNWKIVTGVLDANQYTKTARIFYQDTQAKNTPNIGWFYLIVDAPSTSRITQTLIRDNTTDTWTRVYNGSWQAWTKGATNLDVTALSNRITTNSTQITQNKQAIALKADQSTVNNLSGEVSQNKAQLQIQAGQISSKVSSTEYQTLKGKVDGMQIGTRNLLHNTSDQYRTLTGGGWLGQTTASSMLTSVANYHGGNWFTYAATVSNTSTKTVTLETWLFDQNKQSISVKNAEGIPVATHSQDVPPGQNSMRISTSFRITSGTWFVRTYVILKGGDAPANSKIQVKDERLVEGNVAGTWEANPDDLITSITKNATAIDQTNQKISLKADQTEVDQIKNTAAQNSSRLNVMAGEISSKVTSTDVNNIVDKKGYATTSTVQSLITQKAGTINESITNLDAKYSAKDGVNLVRASGFHNVTLDDLKNSGWSLYDMVYINKNGGSNKTGSLVIDAMTSTSGLKDAIQTVPLEPDTDYTLSFHLIYAGIASGKSFNAWSYVVEEDSNGNAVSPYVDHNCPMANSDDRKQNTRTFHTSKDTHQGVLYLRAMAGTKIELEEVKLEHGSVATPWTPAPSDNATVTQVQEITASIDGLQSTVAKKADKSQITQLSNVIQSKVSSSDFNDLKDKTTWKSTDSIDLNNAVSQQKIFVKGGSNLPPGDYWWYVQVEPGYDSRIVQYAVSDRDNIHYSRQYDGTQWTAWSQGATESEITQLRDDINLRVKSGDLLSQINIQAGRTLIQSQKIYMDADSVIMGPNTKAFIPSAAIVSLDAGKINTGTLNTQMVSIGDDQTRLWARSNYLYLTGKEQGDAYNMRIGGDKIEFVTTEIPNNAPYLDGITPMYSIEYNGDAKARLKVRSFNRLTGSNEFPVEMYDSVNISKDELDFAANNQMKMQVVDGGVNVRPTLFLQNNTNNGTWAGFTRLDNSDTVEFNTGNNNGENFHVNSGARFMQYVYINGYARAQQWLTNSALSKKMNIRKLDLQTALDKIRQDDQYLYEYKRNVAQGIHDPQASFIIDDVHDVAHYSVPREFIDQTGKYREPNVELAYLIAAFQAIDKQVQAQQSEIKALKEQLQHE